ncbi:MAG: FAD-binding oxidoreductase, partial [Proteobacteria bacterium]|nr:FAD-binding oxidoreductase [Pseudomonadota bacterium]
MNNYDYIVLGGGVIGMTTARELAKRGASVAIFDRGILGMEASWAAGGILSSMRPWQEHPDSAELSRRGKTLYLDYCESLKAETGIDPEYFRSGLIVIDQDHIDRLLNWTRGKDVQFIDTDNFPKEINLPQRSVLLPEIAQIRPPRLIAALCKSLKLLSVDIFEKTEIKKIITHDSRFTGVVFDKGSVSAGSLIITAGAWCNSILKNINR